MKSIAKFGLVGTLAFFAGVVWQFDFFQERESAHRNQSNEETFAQKAPEEKLVVTPETSEPSLSATTTRAIEHYRQVIQLGVAERLVQQRIHTEALREREALAAAQKKAKELARIEEQERKREREKIQRQLILATAKAQEAQADLAHERAQQAALETQWLLKEEQRRREELAFQRSAEEHLKKESKRQQLLNLHTQHQFISTMQARKARAEQPMHRQCKQQPQPQKEHHRSALNRSSQAVNTCPPPKQNSSHQASSNASQRSQHQKAVKTYKETFQRQAQEQKELIRAAWKKKK